MPSRLLRAALSLAVAAVFTLCCGWGATGHKVIGQIAYDHLTPKAKVEVDTLLAGGTLAEFSVWPDMIKGDPAWKWTKPWHFADMPEGATTFDMHRDCPGEGCVVRGVTRYAAELKARSGSKEEQQQALMFLAHYVGDLHQPLHIGHKKDKGGNSIEVQLFSRNTNLHSVWDDGIMRTRGMDYGPYARKLEQALKPTECKVYLAVTDPAAWASESHKVAVERAYRNTDGTAIKSGDTLGDAYVKKNTPVVDEQLIKAGLRLAQLLNTIYDPGAEIPPATPPPVTEPKSADPAGAKPALKADTKFVGSKRSEVYHLPGCKDCKTIAPGNLVEYSEAPAGKRLHQGCPR